MKRVFFLVFLFQNICCFGQTQLTECQSNDLAPLLTRKIKQQYLLNRELLTTSSKKKLPDSTLTIPCVFHILHAGGVENITDEQVIGCIDQMNEDFNGMDQYDYNPDDQWGTEPIPEFVAIKANVGMRFELAKLDPEGNSTSGIVRQFLPAQTVQRFGQDIDMRIDNGWPGENYLNIYILRSAGGESGSAWAYYPGVDPDYDGVTSSFWAVGRSGMATPTHYKIMTHEVGHWADLRHTFEGGCGNADGVADTPACTQGVGCDHYQSPCGVLANRQNYMDYGACAIMFTEGQKTRMLNAMASSESARNNLGTKENLTATGIIGEHTSALFYSNQLMTVPNDTILFTDLSQSTSIEITQWDWEFPGGNPASFSGATPPPIVYPNEGKFDVKLTVSKVNGEQDFELKKEYISVQKEVFVQNARFEVDEISLYDTGFKSNYGNRTDAVLVLYPNQPDHTLLVSFSSFNLRTNCDNDYLKIYDGPSTSSPLIGTYCGTDLPSAHKSSHESGALTFEFHTNVSNTAPGFEASIQSISLVEEQPLADFYTLDSASCMQQEIHFIDTSLGIPSQWKWHFENGTPEYSSEQNPIVTYNNSGKYSVKLVVSNQEGSDSLTRQNYVYIRSNPSLPFIEDFESDNFANYSIYNPDNSHQFIRSNRTGKSSSYCLNMNNSNNKKIGEIDEIIFLPFDLSGDYDQPSLTFDLAYTKFRSVDKDILSIFISTDCGNTWKEVWLKDNVAMETATISQNSSSNWAPSTDTQWRTETIDLNEFNGSKSVLLKFRNLSGWGTNIWIDNINVDGLLSSDVSKEFISIHPNPVQDILSLEISSTILPSTYSIYNGNGALVQQGSLNRIQEHLNLESFKSGNYTLQINNKNKKIIKHLVKID